MLPVVLFLAVHIAPEAADLPLKQPQLAADGKYVYLTFGAGKAIYFTKSADQGRTFSKPVKVAEAPMVALGRHRGPRIVATSQALVISAIIGTKHDHRGGGDGDLKAWRSTDGGATWTGPATINDVAAAAREGLHAMAAGNGLIFATWLDLRATGTKLYGATSHDGGATWSKNTLVYQSPDGTICQCCHPSALVDAKGAVYSMWRNVIAGNRDMYVAKSSDGGKTFSAAEKQGTGAWLLNACPMDGGGVALTADGKVVTLWRRDTEIFLAKGGAPESRLDVGKDPALAVAGDQVYAVWTRVAEVYAKIPGKSALEKLDASGAFPNVIATPAGDIVAAWESNGQIAVRLISGSR